MNGSNSNGLRSSISFELVVPVDELICASGINYEQTCEMYTIHLESSCFFQLVQFFVSGDQLDENAMLINGKLKSQDFS